MKDKLRTFFIRVVVVLIGLMIALVIAEIGLRVFYPIRLGPDFRGITITDAKLGYRFIPNSSKVIHGAFNDYKTEIRINSNGFRSPEISIERPAADTVRIFLLGDSEVFGVGVNEAEMLNSRMTILLNTGNKKTYQVLNFGMPGTSPVEQEIILNEQMPKWHPDIVISCITVANDLGDVARSQHTAGFTDAYRKSPLALTHLYQLLKAKALPWLPRLLVPNSSMVGDYPPFIAYWFMNDNIDASFDLMTSCLLRMKKTCDDHGVRMILTEIPARSQFNPVSRSIMSRTVPKQQIEMVLKDIDRPQRMLRAFAKQYGIRYVSALPTFLEWENHRHLLLKYKNDGHLNAIGTEALAMLLADVVASEEMSALPTSADHKQVLQQEARPYGSPAAGSPSGQP